MSEMISSTQKASHSQLWNALRWEFFLQRSRIGILLAVFATLVGLEWYLRFLFESQPSGDFAGFVVFLGTLGLANGVYSEYKNPKQQILAMMLPNSRWHQFLSKTFWCFVPLALAGAVMWALQHWLTELPAQLSQTEGSLFWFRWLVALCLVQFFQLGGLVFSNNSFFKSLLALGLVVFSLLLLQAAFLGDFIRFALSQNLAIPDEAIAKHLDRLLNWHQVWLAVVAISLTSTIWFRFRDEEVK